MRFSVLVSLFLLVGCQHLSNLKIPLQIKAVIEGEIKGHKIHCEKTLALDKGQWGVMCSIGNDMDVKYRVNKLHDGQALVEFMVSKDKAGESKVIAAPALLVKENRSAQNVSTTDNSNIIVTAERIP